MYNLDIIIILSLLNKKFLKSDDFYDVIDNDIKYISVFSNNEIEIIKVNGSGK